MYTCTCMYIICRRSFGRSVFVRCEILQRGETYHVIFLDACDYPPPFKLENLSQVSVPVTVEGTVTLLYHPFYLPLHLHVLTIIHAY